MDNAHKTEVEYIVAIQKCSDTSQDELIAILTDILVEGFMWQLEGKTEELKEEVRSKKLKNDPQDFYY